MPVGSLGLTERRILLLFLLEAGLVGRVILFIFACFLEIAVPQAVRISIRNAVVMAAALPLAIGP